MATTASSVQQEVVLLFAILVVLLPAVVSSTAAVAAAAAAEEEEPVFDENYVAAWGGDGYHFVNDQGTEIRLTMDENSGAGFRSKSTYGSGFFHMRIKIPAGYTAGVVTAFYLASEPETGVHDELDFEFLGDKDGKPVTLQTNVYVDGHGDREQRTHLWFDPAAAFHDYKILWNPYLVVMFVDETPVRVFKNLTGGGGGGEEEGFEFPAKRMLVRGSVWDGSDWATDGGESKVDWGRAPFAAAFRGFGVDGCASAGDGGAATPSCGSPDLWWNAGEYRGLTAAQQAAYDGMKSSFTYDYCADEARFKNHLPPECSFN